MKPVTLAAKASSANHSLRPGRVTLVGAGPGDPDYLTVKAMRVLQTAEVVLFDDLVSPAVLELAPLEAERIPVGKRGGRVSCRQDDINALMIVLAKGGRHVVRLKSGDPMIFGRAGEEIAALEREGIAVEVVPGITAGLALAAELRTSLTHRDCAQSVRFVTGHARDGKLPRNLDWHALADPATTHIYYMAGRTAGELARRLLFHGLDASTPVVVASDVGRVTRQVTHIRLDQLAELEIELECPVIIGIGEAMRAAQGAEGTSLLRAG
ncbi:uroporphyrin-III C-methyltransferase / precorrin-2 dehydrogenase / sirohydrochlorin ferrochelatase [Devosia crocina]|uniref:uroporphyrinogen-III C-methyltransferase n=1 Tax=Devosia crocina TaxID=429728 RepID=A0A1I7NKE0_9HYPH|nr:uroporphyrin-III C-methyltransferase / precorrin-2 dehydrogenase / sirohydrochlorin ferrochelatase [Devosia crocina]